MGGKTDLKGNVLIKHVRPGDYTFGAYNTHLTLPNILKPENKYIAKFYPNPSNGLATIELKANNIKGNLVLYDLKGSLLQTITTQPGKLYYEISANSKGIYIIKYESPSGQVLESLKWIVE